MSHLGKSLMIIQAHYGENYKNILKDIKDLTEWIERLNTGVGKSKFIVVSTQNSLFLYHLVIIVLFSVWTAVNLLLPHPVL